MGEFGRMYGKTLAAQRGTAKYVIDTVVVELGLRHGDVELEEVDYRLTVWLPFFVSAEEHERAQVLVESSTPAGIAVTVRRKHYLGPTHVERAARAAFRLQGGDAAHWVVESYDERRRADSGPETGNG